MAKKFEGDAREQTSEMSCKICRRVSGRKSNSIPLDSMELREIEKTKIACARRFFDEINRKINPANVKYDVVNSFSKLMQIVGAGTIASGGGAC